ncbi:MAG: hypothetical protein NTY45_09380 [Elusimicrobia bacterium]|nr:hypothetical protein [Elusimicrobiota bacterium]
MNDNFFAKKIVAVLVTGAWIFAFAASSCFAGQLDDFEKAAVQKKENDKDKNKEKSKKSGRYQRIDPTSKEEDDSGGIFADVVSLLITYPGVATMARVRRSPDPAFADSEIRVIGAPDIPIIRAELNYQQVNSHIFGVDGRLLAGYGPFGVQYRQTHYSEDAAWDSLELIQIHGLYRVSMNKKFEFDMGFGGLILDGNAQTSGFSMTYPLSVFPSPHFGFNVTPAWSWLSGNLISDYDWSASYVRKFYSVRLGYRRNRAGGEKLTGPYFGVSCYY